MSKFFTGFRFAWNGVIHLFRSQLNARVHLVVTVLVLSAGLVLGVSALEWGMLVICIVLVLAVEGLNTAIELLADAVHPEQHPLVGRAKDVAAGAVLLVSVGSALVGLIIFLPYLGIRL